MVLPTVDVEDLREPDDDVDVDDLHGDVATCHDGDTSPCQGSRC